MSPEQNKKSAGISRLLMGFAIGFLAWLAGFHCMEMDPNGNIHLSTKKILGHELKVFLWALGITLLCEILGRGLGRCGLGPGFGILGVLLVWAVLFTGLRFFKRGLICGFSLAFTAFPAPQCYTAKASSASPFPLCSVFG